jgi:hypothetical protein
MREKNSAFPSSGNVDSKRVDGAVRCNYAARRSENRLPSLPAFGKIVTIGGSSQNIVENAFLDYVIVR